MVRDDAPSRRESHREREHAQKDGCCGAARQIPVAPRKPVNDAWGGGGGETVTVINVWSL